MISQLLKLDAVFVCLAMPKKGKRSNSGKINRRCGSGGGRPSKAQKAESAATAAIAKQAKTETARAASEVAQ